MSRARIQLDLRVGDQYLRWEARLFGAKAAAADDE